MKPTAALAHGAWLAASLPAWYAFRQALREPAAAQEAVWRGLLREGAASAYGRKHGLGEVRTYAQFCARIPVVDYAALAPWIARVRQGERAVLTPAPVSHLVPTSGTTAGRKLVPFTAGLQREFHRALGPWLVDLCRQYPGVPWGPGYWSVSPAIPEEAPGPSAVRVGFDDDSSYLGAVQRQLAGFTFAVPSSLRLIRDLETFRYATLLALLRQPELAFASVWHPSFLTLLLEAMPPHWEELRRDVASGECPRVRGEPAEMQAALRGRPWPGRAQALERLDPGDFRGIWPRWRVVSCWGDGQAGLALAGLQARLPHATLQPKGLLATEAFVTIPFAGGHPVAVRSHFYEFADETGKIWRTHELRPGERYQVIVTTAGGLWRYRLGDWVEVKGFVAATPSLRFLGRGGGTVDLCGEKLAEPFVTAVLERLSERLAFTPRSCLLAPERPSGGPPHYTAFVEGTPPAGFASGLEAGLRENPHYALARDLGQLGPLCLCQVSGAEAAMGAVHLRAGGRLGELKPAVLSARTDWRAQFVPAGEGAALGH